MVPGKETTRDEQKPQPEGMRIETSKNALMVRIVGNVDRLPMEATDSPSAENLTTGNTNLC